MERPAGCQGQGFLHSVYRGVGVEGLFNCAKLDTSLLLRSLLSLLVPEFPRLQRGLSGPLQVCLEAQARAHLLSPTPYPQCSHHSPGKGFNIDRPEGSFLLFCPC